MRLQTLLVPLAVIACSSPSGGVDDAGSGGTDGAVPVDARPGADGGAVEIATRHYLPRSLGADATHIYWIDEVNEQSQYAEGSVWRVARGGGVAEAVAEHQYSPGPDLAIDDDAVYWTASGTNSTAAGSVMRWSKAGGDPVAIATDEAQPWALSLDGEHVYFTAYGTFGSNNAYLNDGSVRRVAKTGGPVEVLTHASKPSSIAVADVVYFAATGGFGGTRQVPKSGGAAAEVSGAGSIWSLGTALLSRYDSGLVIAPLGDGEVVSVAGSSSGVVLGVQGGGFLWNDFLPSAGDAIRQGNVDGTATVLHEGPVRASSAVVTDEGIYFSERPSGATHEARILLLGP